MSVRVGDGDWIAVDWGTTTMRAALVSGDGTVRATAPEGPGMALTRQRGGAFEDVLSEAVAPWLTTGSVDVLLCGMAGARTGWLEASYREVPAQLTGLLDAAVVPPTRDGRLRVRIVPGLCARAGQNVTPDVMRGEETQLLGLLTRTEHADVERVCLPGTHSKWVDFNGATVTGFRTHMTGELNALLRDHSMLSGDLAGNNLDDGAFDDAVRAALDAGGAVLPRLFAIRARGLLDGSDPAHARATLSGLLIGAEVAAEASGHATSVHLVGGGNLTALYARALSLAGIASTVHDGGDLAVAGLAAMRQGDRRGA